MTKKHIARHVATDELVISPTPYNWAPNGNWGMLLSESIRVSHCTIVFSRTLGLESHMTFLARLFSCETCREVWVFWPHVPVISGRPFDARLVSTTSLAVFAAKDPKHFWNVFKSVDIVESTWIICLDCHCLLCFIQIFRTEPVVSFMVTSWGTAFLPLGYRNDWPRCKVAKCSASLGIRNGLQQSDACAGCAGGWNKPGGQNKTTGFFEHQNVMFPLKISHCCLYSLQEGYTLELRCFPNMAMLLVRSWHRAKRSVALPISAAG